ERRPRQADGPHHRLNPAARPPGTARRPARASGRGTGPEVVRAGQKPERDRAPGLQDDRPGRRADHRRRRPGHVRPARPRNPGPPRRPGPPRHRVRMGPAAPAEGQEVRGKGEGEGHRQGRPGRPQEEDHRPKL
ncbi:MAG: hypothetical protein AVDCRST_MAG76-2996, partial [uncultured Acidimicrobiales bacterium]